MRTSNLSYGWDVEKRPLQTLDARGRAKPLDGREAIVRVDPDGREKLLGLVSPAYQFVTHDEMFGLVRPWVKKGDLEVTGLGEVDGGRQVWLQARLRDDRQLGADTLIPYLLLVNGFDGHTALQVVLTPTRVVCANALIVATQAGEEERRAHVGRRGVPLSGDWLHQAVRSYRNTMTMFSDWQDIRLTRKELRRYAERTVLLGEDPAFMGERSRWRDEIVRLAAEGKGNAVQGTRGTLWAAYNGAVEFFDHHLPGRRTAAARYHGPRAAMKRRAFAQALVFYSPQNDDELIEVGAGA